MINAETEQLRNLSLEDDTKLNANGSTAVVMRLILQSADVGKIIGPKGATVEGFKQKTGANISFSIYQPSMPRVAKIAGPVQGVVEAIMLISQTVASEEEEEGEKVLTVVLMVPYPHVGRIIGKRGQRIKQLREESGTSIQIVANNVTISGTYKALENAVLNLTALLQEVSKRNPVSYGFPFENHSTVAHQTLLSNQGAKSALQYHMVQLAPDTMQALIPSSSAGVVIGRGGTTIQRLKTESGASISLSNYVKGAENRVATISGTPQAMAKAILALAVQIATDGGSVPDNAKSLSIVLLVPPQELGAIIGKKGARITELRKETSASVNVADEGSVTIQGNTSAVSDAIRKVAFLLYETRNKISSSNPTPSATSTGATAQPDQAAQETKSKDKSVQPSHIAPSAPINGQPRAPSASNTLFNSKMPVDSKIFLPGLLQGSLGTKIAEDTAKPAKAGASNPANSTTKSNATYAQKTAGIKPSPLEPMINIGMTPSYPPSNVPNTQNGGNDTTGVPMGQPFYHTFNDMLTQQGQPPHQQVLVIGNHWSPHLQLSSQRDRVPDRGVERKVPGGSSTKVGTAGPMLQTHMLGGLGGVVQQQLPSQGSHQLQAHTFNSAFSPLQGNLGQNFYTGATQWYPQATQRFQAYTAEQQQQQHPPNHHQSWQPSNLPRQHQASTVVVPASSIPAQATQPSQSQLARKGSDLWN